MGRTAWVAALVAMTACSGKKPEPSAGSSAAAPDPAPADARPPDAARAPDVASALREDALAIEVSPEQRARERLEAQVGALSAGKNDALRAMFTPDATVLTPRATRIGPGADLADELGAPVELGKVEVGSAPGAIWLTAELDVARGTGAHRAMRVVELLDGARGWAIAAASFAEVKAPVAGATPAAVPSPTEPGPLTSLLGAPTELASALLDDDEGPTVFLAGPEAGDRAIGLVDAKLLAYRLGTQHVALAAGGVREVHTAAWGYAVGNLGPKSLTGLVIALPDVDGKPWRVVAAAYRAAH